MLTRLKVNGFKNLADVDVRFGPFTCIAGPNAVGKSNLFDAIQFLSATASKTLMEAALSVRSEKARNADVRSLFTRIGGKPIERLSFEAEMIVPSGAVDDLGQPARARANFLRYSLELRYRETSDPGPSPRGPLEILKEELVHIPLKQAGKHLSFPHSKSQWRQSALHIESRKASFISTGSEEGKLVIKLHQDGGSRGPAISHAANQPRTVVSAVNAAESPTVLCAKREMESWRLLQLEPAALREPDNVNAPFHLDSNGAHLPATIDYLARSAGVGADEAPAPKSDAESVYCRIANRLSEFIDDVETIKVDRDEKRELLTLLVTGKDGAPYPARSLSDGTLRFLALAVLEMDPQARGLICLEEPENGIHPERIPAMLNLLQAIATDPEECVDDDNPLRQVIVNTHSPSVVLEVPDDCLLIVESREGLSGTEHFRKAVFSHLPDTWRAKAEPSARTVPKGKLLAYLNPISPHEGLEGFYERVGRQTVAAGGKRRPRVADRPDLQTYLPHVAE